MQPGLFEAADADPAWAGVQPAAPDPALTALAGELQARHGDRLFLGTSSWHFPGWAGQVWDRAWPEARLSRDGLPAYAAHPLLRTVSLDRAFYRALGVDEARRLADQARRVAPGFRFVVKAPAALTDAVQRGAGGAPAAPNPGFLDPALAADTAAALAQGLGEMLGVWVLQMSPLPPAWRDRPAQLHTRLARCAEAVAPRLPAGALVGLELRDAGLLTPALAAALRALGWRFVLGLHDRMPPAAEQLPMLRAGWPGDLVCRWNLQRGQRYAQARDRWAPFDRLQSPDPDTRAVLARVMKATLGGCRALGAPRAGASPGTSLGAGEAVGRAPQRAGNDGWHRESPRPGGFGRQVPCCGVAGAGRTPSPAARRRLASGPLAAERGALPKPDSLLDAGHRVFVTINNKAEGSAPASVRALSQALLAA